MTRQQMNDVATKVHNEAVKAANQWALSCLLGPKPTEVNKAKWIARYHRIKKELLGL